MEVLFGISAIINIILLYFLLGSRWRDASRPGLLFASVSVFFVIMVSASLVLTSLGTYSLVNINILSTIMAALQFLLGLFIRFSNKKSKNAGLLYPKGRKSELHHLWLLLLCLTAFFLYSSYTTEYIIGGRDPGVYSNQGIYIGKTGGLSIEDDYIRNNYYKLRSIIQIGSPGFYSAYERGLSSDPGLIIPQFLPLFPSMLALGYSLFGIAGALKINALAGVLSLLAFYAFGKELIGRKGALLAAVFLAFNPSQIWNARITQTELLSQFLFFSAVSVFAIGYRRNSWLLTSITGFLLGLSCFNRIDSYIFGLGVYICTAYIILVQKKKAGVFLSAMVSYSIFMALSFAYGFVYRYPYYSDLWSTASLKLIIAANILFAFLVLLSIAIRYLIIDRKPQVFKRVLDGFLHFKRHGLGLWAAIAFFALFLFAYFIRPIYFNGGFAQGTEQFFTANSLVEFGFYVPEIAMLLSLLGLYFIIREKGINPYLIFLSISLASIFIYTYKPSITPDHPWASRRWITVNIPAVLLLSVYGLRRIRLADMRVNRLVKTAVTVIILVFAFAQSGLYLFDSMLEDYSDQLVQTADTLSSDKIYFTDNEKLDAPLRYIFGKNVYLLKEPGLSEPVIDFIKKEGSVYGIGWPGKDYVNMLFHNGISAELISNQKLTGQYPEESRTYFPKKLIRKECNTSVIRLDYSPENLYYTYVPSVDFYSQNGIREEAGGMTSDGRAGFLLYGNYTVLSAGTYELYFTGSMAEDYPEDMAYIDIAYSQGTQTVAVQGLSDFAGDDGRLEGRMSFTLNQDAADLEFRVYVGENITLSIDKMVLYKIQ